MNGNKIHLLVSERPKQRKGQQIKKILNLRQECSVANQIWSNLKYKFNFFAGAMASVRRGTYVNKRTQRVHASTGVNTFNITYECNDKKSFTKILDSDGDSDHHHNSVSVPCAILDIFWKFYRNPTITF